jgi:thioredoxin reductase
MLHRNTNAVADVLIIGGSHAGLSAALTLYRALHTCIIFDSDKPRNSYGTAVRLTPTWENQDPEAFKRAARKELSASGYTRFVDGEVQRVKTTDDGLFKATDSAGEEWLGRKILLATGSKDIFPPIPGYDALYARGM